MLRLEQDLETEVVIVGGGFTGILSAYMLAKAGVPAVVIEARKVGSGASSATTAFITELVDMSLVEMVNLFGEHNAQKIWESGAQAIETFEEIIREEKIDCAFVRCPLYLYSMRARDLESFKEESVLAHKLGFNPKVGSDHSLGFVNQGYMEFSKQAKFDHKKFIEALAVRVQELGVAIYEDSEVVELSGVRTIEARTAQARVTAKYVIVATHQPIIKPKILASKKAKYKSYVVKGKIPKGRLPEAMFVDSKNPYHYFRVDSFDEKYDKLTMGGSDHRADLPVSEKRSYAALEKFVAELLPDVEFVAHAKWSGPLLESSDGLPYIGEYAPNQFVATGFSGNGMTYSLISAQIFRDKILGKTNPYAKLYDPKRKQTWKQILTNAKHYIGLFFGGAVKNTL